MTPCKIQKGDYILREDIPNQHVLDAVIAEAERQGMGWLIPERAHESMQKYDGVLLLGGMNGSSWLDTRGRCPCRRLTPADLGINTCTGDGLPPVGIVWEYVDSNPGEPDCHYFDEWREGDELEVLAHRHADLPVVVVWNRRALDGQSVVPECLRPIRTERERVIEGAMQEFDEWSKRGSSSIVSDFIAHLYDKGHLRHPKESDNE